MTVVAINMINKDKDTNLWNMGQRAIVVYKGRTGKIYLSTKFEDGSQSEPRRCKFMDGEF